MLLTELLVSRDSRGPEPRKSHRYEPRHGYVKDKDGTLIIQTLFRFRMLHTHSVLSVRGISLVAGLFFLLPFLCVLPSLLLLLLSLTFQNIGRGKTIRSVLCNIVCNNCAQCDAHTYEQTNSSLDRVLSHWAHFTVLDSFLYCVLLCDVCMIA